MLTLSKSTLRRKHGEVETMFYFINTDRGKLTYATAIQLNFRLFYDLDGKLQMLAHDFKWFRLFKACLRYALRERWAMELSVVMTRHILNARAVCQYHSNHLE